MNVSRNTNVFIDSVRSILTTGEKVVSMSGYDVSGLTDDLYSDPQFIYDLQIISCELDISKYINPKTSVLLKVVRKAY